jgi:iron complex outermembrane receptor protein
MYKNATAGNHRFFNKRGGFMKNSICPNKYWKLYRDPVQFISFLVATAALIAGTLPVSAQEEGGALEEIIVTAEFREADVQDTPLAITAVNSDLLEARSQTNLAQITAQAPNVSLRPAGSSFGNSLVAYIRGIGQTDFNPSVEPGVGIYVDDVYYSTITGNVLDLLDLERVEVMRGPQGTLSGRNAIGGAIKLYTRKPDADGGGFASLTYGEYDRTDIKGAAGFTLIPDTLFIRVAGSSRTSDGFVDRLDYACANNLPEPGQPGGLPTYAPSFGCKLGEEGGQSYTAGRIGLRWVVTDDFEINLAGSIVNDDSQSQPGVLVAAKDNSGSGIPILSPTLIGVFTPNPAFNPNSASLVPIFYDNNGNGTYQAGIDVPYDSRFVTGGRYYNYATYINDGKSTPSPLFQGGNPGLDINLYKPYVIEPVNNLRAWDTALNMDWQINDDLAFKSVTAFRRYENFFAEDTDGSPLAVQQLLQVMRHRQFSQELRLNATLFDGYADVTTGWFYMDQRTNEDARVDLPYVGFDFIHGPDLVPSENWALYGHVTLHPTDQIDLSAGLRYSDDEKSYTFRRRNPDLTPVEPCAELIPGVLRNPFFWETGNPAGCGVYGLDLLSVEYSSTRLDWRTALSYAYTDDVMFYAQFASGYKAGGNNARPFFPSQLNAFDPEKLISYEGGMKSTWFDELRVNAAFFWNDYSNIQLPTTVCAWALPLQQTPCASQNNVGDAEVWGLEIEAEWHPTDELTFEATYSHLDYEYSTIDPGATAVTLGMISPYTPENKWSFGAQYEISLGDLGTLTPRVDLGWQGEIFSNAVNGPMNFIEDYLLTNGRLTWRSPDDDWQIALEITNMTDEYYYVTLFDLWGPVGYVHGQPGRPREWALTFKRNF